MLSEEEKRFRRLCFAVLHSHSDQVLKYGGRLYFIGETFWLFTNNDMLSVTLPDSWPRVFGHVDLTRTIFDDALPGTAPGCNLADYTPELERLVPLDALADL